MTALTAVRGRQTYAHGREDERERYQREDGTMTDSANSGLAVVTGASSGIGFELARQFAEHGFELIA